MAGREVETPRCSYCWEFLDSMSDPRLLPCSHISCKTCLENDFTERNGLRCPQCT